MVDDVHVVWSDNLRAVGPVSLVAVVFLGVVRGGDVDAALTAEGADSVGKLGGGTEAVEKICLDAVGREDVGNDFSKFAGVVAHVVADGYGYLWQVGECLLEVVGKALSGGSYGVDVHTVCAGAHNAAQTACAEFEVAVESLDERGLVLGIEHLFHLGTGGLVVLVGEPYFGSLLALLKKFLVFHVEKLCICMCICYNAKLMIIVRPYKQIRVVFCINIF